MPNASESVMWAQLDRLQAREAGDGLAARVAVVGSGAPACLVRSRQLYAMLWISVQQRSPSRTVVAIRVLAMTAPVRAHRTSPTVALASAVSAESSSAAMRSILS